MPEQVQDFYPTPGTVSTCMFYTGIDPWTMQPVFVPTDPYEKKLQRTLLQYWKPENRRLVIEALVRAGRAGSPMVIVGDGAEDLQAFRSSGADRFVVAEYDLPDRQALLSLRPGTQPLHAAAPGSGPVLFLSGPEGGLSNAEEDLALQHGFAPATLGARVLRAETAPLAALAALTLG